MKKSNAGSENGGADWRPDDWDATAALLLFGLAGVAGALWLEDRTFLALLVPSAVVTMAGLIMFLRACFPPRRDRGPADRNGSG